MSSRVHPCFLLILMACGDDHQVAADLDASGPTLLLDHTAWTALDPSQDAFAEHRPPEIRCPTEAIFENLGVLEIETNLCNYVSLGQPLGRALPEGGRLRIPLWHLQLFNSEPAEAHLAVVLGAEVIVDYTVPIPSAARIESREIELMGAYPAGTLVQLHLHNHGQNHWRIGPVELMR